MPDRLPPPGGPLEGTAGAELELRSDKPVRQHNTLDGATNFAIPKGSYFLVYDSTPQALEEEKAHPFSLSFANARSLSNFVCVCV